MPSHYNQFRFSLGISFKSRTQKNKIIQLKSIFFAETISEYAINIWEEKLSIEHFLKDYFEEC